MQVEYTGRQAAVTPSLRQLAEEGLARVAKIVGDGCSAHVVLTAEKYRQSAEVTVQCRQQQIVGLCEAPSMETALRDAVNRVESQAIRHKDRRRELKRQPKDGKAVDVAPLARPRSSMAPLAELAQAGGPVKRANSNGKKTAQPVPVTVHSAAERAHIAEPHVVHSPDAVAKQPMTLEEAVKEAEFRDRDVFVFRDSVGAVNVLHRRRDGTMELIQAS